MRGSLKRNLSLESRCSNTFHRVKSQGQRSDQTKALGKARWSTLTAKFFTPMFCKSFDLVGNSVEPTFDFFAGLNSLRPIILAISCALRIGQPSRCKATKKFRAIARRSYLYAF